MLAQNNHEQYQVIHIGQMLQPTEQKPATLSGEQLFQSTVHQIQGDQIQQIGGGLDYAQRDLINHSEIPALQKLQINNLNNCRAPPVNPTSPTKMPLNCRPRDVQIDQANPRLLSHYSHLGEQSLIFNKQVASSQFPYFQQPFQNEGPNPLMQQHNIGLGLTSAPQGFIIQPQLCQPSAFNDKVIFQSNQQMLGGFGQINAASIQLASGPFNQQLMAGTAYNFPTQPNQQMQNTLSQINSNLPLPIYSQSGMFNPNGPIFSTIRLEERKQGEEGKIIGSVREKEGRNIFNIQGQDRSLKKREQLRLLKHQKDDFERYLGLVFQDLCARDNGLEKRSINFDTFNAYLRSASISLVLSRRLFVAMFLDPANEVRKPGSEKDQPPAKNIQNNDILGMLVSEQAFLKVMATVFDGTHSQQKELIFKIADFKGDGKIKKEDLKMILFHIFSTNKPRHEGFKELFKQYLSVIEGKRTRFQSTINQTGGSFSKGDKSYFAGAYLNVERQRGHFRPIQESNVDFDNIPNRTVSQDQRAFGMDGSPLNTLNRGQTEQCIQRFPNFSNPREADKNLNHLLEHGHSKTKDSIKNKLIEALLSATYSQSCGEEVLTYEEFTKQRDPSLASAHPAPNFQLSRGVAFAEPPTSNQVVQSYSHITRVVIDYLRLTLPCGWQYQKHFEEAISKSQLIRQQSAMLIQKQIIRPFTQHQRHHSNNAVHNASSFIHNKPLQYQSLVVPQQSKDKLSVQQQPLKERASSNSCSLTPPGAGGSSSPISNFGVLNFEDATQKIIEINQQIKNIEQASAHHALLFKSQSTTPVSKGIKLTHQFPVSKASNNKLGKNLFQDISLERDKKAGSYDQELKGQEGEDDQAVWEIGPGKNKMALKINLSKFHRQASPISKGSIDPRTIGKLHDVKNSRSRFAPESKAGRSEISQLNRQDLNDDENSILSSQPPNIISAFGPASGPLKIQVPIDNNIGLKQKVSTPTSKFGNQLSIQVVSAQRAHSPISQRQDSCLLLKQSNMCAGHVSNQVKGQDQSLQPPFIRGHRNLLLGCHQSREVCRAGDNEGDEIREGDQIPLSIKHYQGHLGDNESSEDAINDAIDEGVHNSLSGSIEEDYDVGGDENASQEKNRKVHHPTFNGFQSAFQEYFEDKINVHQPLQSEAKSNYGKFRRTLISQTEKLNSMPIQLPPAQPISQENHRKYSHIVEPIQPQMPPLSSYQKNTPISQQGHSENNNFHCVKANQQQIQDATLCSNLQAHALRDLRIDQSSMNRQKAYQMASQIVIVPSTLQSNNSNPLQRGISKNILTNQYSAEDLFLRSRSREAQIFRGAPNYNTGERNMDTLPLKLNKSRNATPTSAYHYRRVGDEDQDQNVGFVTPVGNTPFNVFPTQLNQQEAQNSIIQRIHSRLSVEQHQRVPSYSPIRQGPSDQRYPVWGGIHTETLNHNAQNNQQPISLFNKKTYPLQRINTPNEGTQNLPPQETLDSDSELLQIYDELFFNVLQGKLACKITKEAQQEETSPMVRGQSNAIISPTLGQEHSKVKECFLLGAQNEQVRFYCKIQGPDLLVGKDPQCENIKFIHSLMNSDFYLLEPTENECLETNGPKYKLKLKISHEHKRVLHFAHLQTTIDLMNSMKKVKQAFSRCTSMTQFISRYQLDGEESNCLIGEGSYGKVYRAIDTETKRFVAVKRIFKKPMSPGELELIYEEIEICRTLAEEAHPQIAHLLDVSEDDDYFLLAVELVEGMNLFRWTLTHMKEVNHDEKEAGIVFRQAIEVLCYLHSRGIAHRDIKLDNLLIYRKNNNNNTTTSWGIKLIDFGLSSTFLSGQTATEVVGSVAYLSPEILSRRPHGRATDIWSLGIVLYILLTGRMPFVDKEVERTKHNIVYKDLDFGKATWERVSQEAISLVQAMLVKDPERRLSASEVLQHPWVRQFSQD